MVNEPSLARFITFIRTIMGIDTTVLPDGSAVIPIALKVALALVNQDLRQVTGQLCPPIDDHPISMYVWAVYNLAGDNLLNYAQDLPDAAIVPGSDPPAAFFANTRRVWNVNGFVSGIIQSASDNGTGESMVVMDAAKNFTLGNLQNLKTPYGRAYLALSQDMGSIWGVS